MQVTLTKNTFGYYDIGPDYALFCGEQLLPVLGIRDRQWPSKIVLRVSKKEPLTRDGWTRGWTRLAVSRYVRLFGGTAVAINGARLSKLGADWMTAKKLVPRKVGNYELWVRVCK
jgi:hypothetical protein